MHAAVNSAREDSMPGPTRSPCHPPGPYPPPPPPPRSLADIVAAARSVNEDLLRHSADLKGLDTPGLLRAVRARLEGKGGDQETTKLEALLWVNVLLSRHTTRVGGVGGLGWGGGY
jgi:hypothetical protein